MAQVNVKIHPDQWLWKRLVISLVIFALIILIVTIPSIASVIAILRPGG